MAILSYCPEMGESKPKNTQGRVSLSHYGKHYFVDTPIDLKGRGVEFLRKYESKDLTPQGQYKVGWNQYKVTIKAMEKLSAQYNFARESVLD